MALSGHALTSLSLYAYLTFFLSLCQGVRPSATLINALTNLKIWSQTCKVAVAVVGESIDVSERTDSNPLYRICTEIIRLSPIEPKMKSQWARASELTPSNPISAKRSTNSSASFLSFGVGLVNQSTVISPHRVFFLLQGEGREGMIP